MTKTRDRLVLVATMLLVGGAGVMWAQAKTDEAGGSLAALTAEVHQLRLAVEESARQQTQTQGLSVYLSAQQSRMVQLGARLDALRGELNAAAGRAREAARLLTTAQSDLAQSTQPQGRAEVEDSVRFFKQQADAAASQVDQLKSREAELALAMQTEEARWADLIGRLEQLIRK